MLAVFADGVSAENPLSVLKVEDLTLPEAPAGWIGVNVKAAALNHHDIWSLKGVGLSAENTPMVLGCDASGVTDDGQEVIVHAVVSTPEWEGDETLDPGRSLLSERHPGTLAHKVWVPARNVVPKPAELSFEQAATLSTSWLTAYRMLFTQAGVRPGETILVQGVGGGVATALIALASSAGIRVWATTRKPHLAEVAQSLGADQVFGSGERLPSRVDYVFDSVGEATWSHSIKSLNPGGVLVTCGATSGALPTLELNRVFFLQLRIYGSTMGTKAELQRLSQFMVGNGIEPLIDSVRPLTEAAKGFEKMLTGDVVGKIVFTA